MMAALREWLLAVVTVTMLLSAVERLIPEGTIRHIASFTGGLVLLVTLLRPMLGTTLTDGWPALAEYTQAVELRRSELETARTEELETRIAERTEAYILEKAAALGLEVQVRVETETGADGIPVPAEAAVTGEYAEALASYMEEELGISRERQVWS